ncbi:MAG: hypothetical protein ISR96_07895 [Nitrospira sp.]|nr:hypothetical protein [bacterium]MBL7049420.1 hypothetical protein [Nitrospira sp.]
MAIRIWRSAAYEKSGDYSLAADRYSRAARSALALGKKKFALALGKKALAAAKIADKEVMILRAQRILDEVDNLPVK